MINFKKAYSFKIMSLITIGLFILNSPAYGTDLPDRSHLRSHLLSDSPEGRERLNDGLVKIDDSHAGSNLTPEPLQAFSIINERAVGVIQDFVISANKFLKDKGLIGTGIGIRTMRVKYCSFVYGFMIAGSDIDDFKIYYTGIPDDLIAQLRADLVQLLQDENISASGSHQAPQWIEIHDDSEVAEKERGKSHPIYTVYSAAEEIFPFIDENGKYQPLAWLFEMAHEHTVDKIIARFQISVLTGSLDTASALQLIGDKVKNQPYIQARYASVKEWIEQNGMKRLEPHATDLIEQLHGARAFDVEASGVKTIVVPEKNIDSFKDALGVLLDNGLVEISVSQNGLIPIWAMPDVFTGGLRSIRIEIESCSSDQVRNILREVSAQHNTYALIRSFDNATSIASAVGDETVDSLVQSLGVDSAVAITACYDRLVSKSTSSMALYLLSIFDSQTNEKVQRIIIYIIHDIIKALYPMMSIDERDVMRAALNGCGIQKYLNDHPELKYQKEAFDDIRRMVEHPMLFYKAQRDKINSAL